MDASAGLSKLFATTVKEREGGRTFMLNMPLCDGAVRVSGESMYPLIQSGDIILYKTMRKEMGAFVWGEMC